MSDQIMIRNPRKRDFFAVLALRGETATAVLGRAIDDYLARYGAPIGTSVGKGDPLYAEAVDFVHEEGCASISLLQRRFKIGFNLAVKYLDQLKEDGVVDPHGQLKR